MHPVGPTVTTTPHASSDLAPFSAGSNGADAAAVELSFVRLAAVLLRRWRTLFWTTVIAGFITIVAVLVWPRTYTTFVSFAPLPSASGGISMGQLSALASQFGFGSLAQGPEQS